MARHCTQDRIDSSCRAVNGYDDSYVVCFCAASSGESSGRRGVAAYHRTVDALAKTATSAEPQQTRQYITRQTDSAENRRARGRQTLDQADSQSTRLHLKAVG